MEPHPDTIFHRHPLMSSIGSACAIVLGAFAAYSIFLQAEGRQTVRIEEFERKDQILLRYIPAEVVRRDYLSNVEVEQKYVPRADLTRACASIGEAQKDCISKKEIERDYFRKDEVARLWLTKEEVQRDYVNRSELKEKYFPKEEVFRLWVLKTEVKQNPSRPDKPLAAQPAPRVSTSADEAEDGDFSMRVLDCSSRGTKVVCQLSVTNEGEERNLMLSGRVYPPSSRMFDPQGNEYQPELLTLGSNQSEGGAQILVPVGVPVKAQISFAPVPRDLSSIALLEVQCAAWGQKSNNRRLTFRFKNVNISKH
jgi:hypothetical protein